MFLLPEPRSLFLLALAFASARAVGPFEGEATREGLQDLESRLRKKPFQSDSAEFATLGHVKDSTRQLSMERLRSHPITDEAIQNEKLLKKDPAPDFQLLGNRKYGSLPPSEPRHVIGIEAQAKARKAAAKINDENVRKQYQTKLGRGLGFPPYRRTMIPWMRPNSVQDAQWKRHYNMIRPRVQAERGDASLYHRHANRFVDVYAPHARASFHAREPWSAEKDHQKFAMHHRNSMTSDGRYSGDGSFLGKSPLALGAEGAPGMMPLTQVKKEPMKKEHEEPRDSPRQHRESPGERRKSAGQPETEPGYQPGQYQHQLRGTASESEDRRATIMTMDPRIENLRKERQAGSGQEP